MAEAPPTTDPSHVEEDIVTIDSFADAWDLVADKIVGWSEGLVAMIPNALLALAVLALGVGVAIFTARSMRRLGRRVFDRQALVDLTSGIVKAGIIIAFVFVTLSILNLDKTVTSLLAGAGIVGLAIGLAFQDLASNFIAGFFMGVRKPFNIGDMIQSGDLMGTVRALNMRNTMIENFDGQMLVVPNKRIFENPLVNYDAIGKRRLAITVGVAYDSDLDQVERVLRAACSGFDFIHPDHTVEVWCTALNESSVDWQIFLWVRQPGKPGYFAVMDRAIRTVFNALRDAGITIPFPSRTITVDGLPRVVVDDGRDPSTRPVADH